MLNDVNRCKHVQYTQNQVAFKMNNPFDFQSQEPCLQFLKQDSSHNQSDLFKQNESQNSSLKIEEEAFFYDNQIQFPNNSKSKKNKDFNLENKHKKKTFYKDKMASLMEEQGQLKNYYHYSENAQSTRGKSPISRDEQLKRNRESAKQSRQRRKEYVQTLQDKNREYKKTIQELTYRLRETQMERDRLKENNRSYFKSFLSSKNEAYQKLTQVLQCNNKSSLSKVGEHIKQLKAKYGAAGSERIATTDYYVKEIIQILIGDVHKYLVACANNNSGLFGLGSWSNLDDSICKILNVNKPLRVSLTQKFRDKMVKQFETFKDIAQNFYDVYSTVQAQAKVIQKIFDEVSLQFSDDSIARLLIWLQQNKFHPDIKKMRGFWIHSVEEKQQTMDKVRKISNVIQ